MAFWKEQTTIRYFRYFGNDVPIDFSFDNVLTVHEVLEYEGFDEFQKYDTIFEVLTPPEIWEHFPTDHRVEMTARLLKEWLDIDLVEPKEGDGEIPLFDFIEDAGRIHSSFLFDYGMDLREQHGKMDWDTFKELFLNLSDDSQMGLALHYRQCPIPKREKGNEEEIKRIKRQKERYALKSDRVELKVKKMKEMELLAKMQAHSRKAKGG